MKNKVRVVIAIAAVIVVSLAVVILYPRGTEFKAEEKSVVTEQETVDPSPSSVEEEKKSEETHEEIIARLVADVNSGKAGNGDARKEYLGEYYDEVQTIINKEYAEIAKREAAKQAQQKKSVSQQSSGNTQAQVATGGSKAEYQAYARDLVLNTYGWTEADFDALVKLWNHESGWNPNSVNRSSGACGIPQALPCSKIVNQQGSNDWRAQIRWGLNYIRDRQGYGSPTRAWEHFQNKGWY